MMKTFIQSLEMLLRLLVHRPTPALLDAVVDDIQAKIQTGKVDDIQAKIQTGKELSWAVITQALNKVVGDDYWDTALLLVAIIEPIQQTLTHFDKEKVRESLELKLHLRQKDERAAVETAFAQSHLRTVLTPKRSTLKEVITARKDFLKACFDALTTDVFFPNRHQYFNIARRGVFLTRIGSGIEDYANECFQQSILKVMRRFRQLEPETYGGYLQLTMHNGLREHQQRDEKQQRKLKDYQEERYTLVSCDGDDDDDQPSFDIADDCYDPETPAKEAEAVMGLLKGIKAAANAIVKQKALTKKRVRQLYILFHLSYCVGERPKYKEIADEFGMSIAAVNKDVSAVRQIIANHLESEEIGLPGNTLFSKHSI